MFSFFFLVYDTHLLFESPPALGICGEVGENWKLSAFHLRFSQFSICQSKCESKSKSKSNTKSGSKGKIKSESKTICIPSEIIASIKVKFKWSKFKGFSRLSTCPSALSVFDGQKKKFLQSFKFLLGLWNLFLWNCFVLGTLYIFLNQLSSN